MANTPQLSDKQNDRLRNAMVAWLRRPKMQVRPGEKPVYYTYTDLARALGLQQPTISEFVKGKKLASYDTAKRFATLTEQTIDALIGPDERDPHTILEERGNMRRLEWRELPQYMDALSKAIVQRPEWSPLIWEAIAREKAPLGRDVASTDDLVAVGDRLQRAETFLQRKGLVLPARTLAEPKTAYRRTMSDIRRLAGIGSSPKHPASGGMKTSR